MDDDDDCAHVFELTELHPTTRGMQRAKACTLCGTPAYDPGQAATRPPLAFGTGDTA